MRVFLTGGTGLIGTRLIKQFQQRGDTIVLLTRRRAEAAAKFPICTVVEGDPQQPGAWQDALADCDGVINLAGEGIFNQRWTDDFKKRLYDSRIKTTDNVVAALAKHPKAPSGAAKVLVNASAIGYYGAHGDEELTEESSPATDMLAHICVDWEKSANAASGYGVRVVPVRIGVVLAKEGGALNKLLLPFKLGAGGPVGTGKQWMSWIHHADMVGILLHALDHAEIKGPLNGTAPKPVTNKEFGHALGRVLSRPSFMPTPAFALHLALGEAAVLVTKGQKVLPKHTLATGYQFKFPEIDAALKEIISAS